MDPEALEAALFLPVKRWGNARDPFYASGTSESTKEPEHAFAHRRCATDIPSPSLSTLPTTPFTGNIADISISQHRSADRIFNGDEKTTNAAHEETEETVCSRSGRARDNSDGSNIVLHLWIGVGGSAEAVTFAVERLAVGTAQEQGLSPVWAVLDCAGSANASPMFGTVDLKRQVSEVSGWRLTDTLPRRIIHALREAQSRSKVADLFRYCVINSRSPPNDNGGAPTRYLRHSISGEPARSQFPYFAAKRRRTQNIGTLSIFHFCLLFVEQRSDVFGLFGLLCRMVVSRLIIVRDRTMTPN